MGFWRDIAERRWGNELPQQRIHLDGLSERFLVDRELGIHSSQSKLYAAVDLLTGQDVVVKHYKYGHWKKEQFEREVLSGLKSGHHPNVIRIIDYSEQGNYIIMPLIKGRDLYRMLREPFEPKRALAITAHICEGLKHIHKKGIVHGDIKLDNILMDVTHEKVDEESLASFTTIVSVDNKITIPKITDFGLSHHAELDLTHKRGRGTPLYMAPEIWKELGANPASDVYALGILIYEMLTRETPYGDTQFAHVYSSIPRHDSIKNDKLLKLIKAACEKKPEKRPTPLELIESFRRAVYG